MITAVSTSARRQKTRATHPPGRDRTISIALDLAGLGSIAAYALSGRLSFWAHFCCLCVIVGAFVRPGWAPTVWRALTMTAALVAGAVVTSGGRPAIDGLIVIAMLLAISLPFALMAGLGERQLRRQDRDQVRIAGLLVAVEDIGAESQLDSMLQTVSATAAGLLSTSATAPVIARVVRIERDTMVVVAEHGHTQASSGTRHALISDPLVLATVTEDRTITNAELDYRDVSPLAGAAGFGTRAASPIHVNGDVYGALVVEFPGRVVSSRELADLDGLATITSLAVGNVIGAESATQQFRNTDALTGLVNRHTFSDRLEAARGAFAVLAVDVDRLKSINHNLSREAGDDALRAVARSLTSSMREHDLIARVGGDEFAILINGAGTAIVGAAAERVRAAVSGLVGGPLPVRVSVGWAVGSPGDDAQAVWALAGEALLRAKHEGGNRVSGSITGRSTGTPSKGWTTLLSRVLASQQINPVYQPIVRLSDQRVVAYEGLARPASLDADDSVEDFFAIAHQLGVVNELDWICRRAVVRGAEGLRADTVLYCNIDLSAVDDAEQDVDQLLTLLSWAGRDPGDLVLEVTDADRFTDLGQLIARIDAYRRFGFRIAIDDAGREGMGIGLLHAVCPDVIKIDGAITNGCFENQARRFILEAIALADQTGATVVAEGIEDQGIADELARLGVDFGQGYLFGRPTGLPERSPERESQPMVLRAVSQRV